MLDDNLLGMLSPDMSMSRSIRQDTPNEEGSVSFTKQDPEAWGQPSHDGLFMTSHMPVQLPNHMDQGYGPFVSHQPLNLPQQQWLTPPSEFEGFQASSVSPFTEGPTDAFNSYAMMPPHESCPMPSMVELDSDQGLQPPHLTRAAYRRHASAMRFRGDGIRKKNARFEIPAEVNLDTVDRLISQATNENVVKELKQQKRLLRNRQAALDSRLRKKQHTEKLEDEMKQASLTIQGLQQELERMKQIDAMQRREQAYLAQRNADLQQAMEKMQADHICETEALRQKNRSLFQQVDKLNRPVAGLGFNELNSSWPTYASGETLQVVDHDLNTGFDSISAPSLSPLSSPSFSVVEPDTASKQNDLPFSWNVFCLCLLLGAYVASTGKVSGQLPQLSEGYRKESQKLLDAVMPSDSAASADNKGPIFASMNGNTEANAAKPDALQQLFAGLQSSMANSKPALSEKALQDFKTFVQAN
ncbi:hypothetical protein KEM55_004484 [Ascosphaera atra]|nr:hypothetical protein KEM55_004484 [Ascosphaera atra]